MAAVTPKIEHSPIVRPAEMEWEKTRFPGCEAKTLLFDKSTGLVTRGACGPRSFRRSLGRC